MKEGISGANSETRRAQNGRPEKKGATALGDRLKAEGLSEESETPFNESVALRWSQMKRRRGTSAARRRQCRMRQAAKREKEEEDGRSDDCQRQVQRRDKRPRAVAAVST